MTLEEPQRVPDGAGGFNETWVALGDLWAEIKAGTGSEKAANHVTLSSISFRITLRAAPHGAPSRPKPEQRFRAGTRIFLILAVAEADRGAQYLTCFAKEEVAA
uniref:head-tail adaptor protein n=1 Tax=Aliiroseovarius salicola TaxID=3009082 RepID=UPI0038CBF7E2